MSTEEQVAYWKYHSRKHEDTATKLKGGISAEDAKRLTDRIAELEREKLTEDQRTQADAIEAAKAAAAEEARQQLMPQLRGAELRGFASIVLSGDRLNNWLDTVNAEAFVGEDGHVDGDKVVTHLTALFGEASPAGASPVAAPPRHPNYGQGQSGAGRAPRGESGRAEAIRRGWVKPEPTTTTS
ncbi:hypothetical protein IU485_27985 [Nocardia cyriacigeorgica]|uniref:hypothetical protein n=1 Tax=Nocardia cyriacigeorgica TaxID=135487 RepID=UPI0018961940|nr:hypothetical protein [Nocardia cyriacigeorgica]MBF6085213.1 hypothetical protein [Nocardia cyriacigeorgica]